ncbi:hypothetical protein [Luteitalea sp. TBR-22]|uniref:hypothetical protein n=1 Tax=Luteitalea sp. TBR-22 TaxID=2802971 RepID=UPI001EF419C9|nr:hypothetical protein [Luteitalea sp. TBR-22]
MNHIVRAFAVWVGIYAGCLTALGALWFWKGPEDSTIPEEGALLGGTIALWFAVMFGRAAVKRLRERAAVGRADDVDRPVDGEFVVARGTLQCAAPLVSPFTGVPVAAYNYKAWRREVRGPGTKTSVEIAYWWGEGSAPCSLMTRRGTLELRSRPWLDFWSAGVPNTDESRGHFSRFMHGVQAEPQQGGIVVPGFEWDAGLDGPLRRDKAKTTHVPLEELQFTEWTLSPGEPVVVIGRYSAQRGGVIHDDRKGRPLRVLKGDAETVRAALGQGATAYGVLSLLALGVSAFFAASILRWHDLAF